MECTTQLEHGECVGCGGWGGRSNIIVILFHQITESASSANQKRQFEKNSAKTSGREQNIGFRV